MKIGIDLDGVVFDSETTFRTYEEIFDIDVLHGNNLVDKEEPKYQGRYNWTEDQEKQFINDYFLKVSKETTLMSGFSAVYPLLKSMGHELIVITARGGYVKKLAEDALKTLEKCNINFDKYYFAIKNKLEICKKENIDLMIDDDYKIIDSVSNAKIKTLYFRDANMKKLPENEYITEVNNWGDVYRYLKNIGN